MLYFITLPIIEKLDTDGDLRMKLALELGISERAVYNAVKKYLKEPFANSSFTKIAAVEFFQSWGLDREDILTLEKPAVY